MGKGTNFMRKQLPENSFEATLARMMESSTLTSGVIAILLIVALMYCIVGGGAVPDIFTYAISTIIGFFFGSRTSDALIRDRSNSWH